MAARNIGGILTAPSAPRATAVIKRRHLTTVMVGGTTITAVYKMRGWDGTGMVYYHWTTSDPTASPPGGYPSLTGICIAATLVEPT